MTIGSRWGTARTGLFRLLVAGITRRASPNILFHVVTTMGRARRPVAD